MPHSISANPDFSKSTVTLNTLASNVEEILAESSLPMAALYTVTVTPISYTSQSFAYTLVYSYSSDVQYETGYQSISITENNTASVLLTLPCSLSGSTSISFSLSAYTTYSVPSWIQINSTTGSLNIASPVTSIDTDYYFYVNSIISGVVDPVQKVIKLTVK